MRLNEAEKILNDNGYELLEEGKLGKALATGVLALSTLFTNAIGSEDQFNLRRIDDEPEKIEHIKDYLENKDESAYCKIKNKGIICKHRKTNSIDFYPSKSLLNLNISDDIARITFSHYGSSELQSMSFIYDDGSSYGVGFWKSGYQGEGYIWTFDEFDNKTSEEKITVSKAENSITKMYNKLMSEFSKSDYVEVEENEEDYKSLSNEDKINRIMDKYK